MKKLEQCLVSTFKMTYSKNIWRFLKWCYPQVIQIRPFEYCNPWFCGSSWLEKPVKPSMPSGVALARLLPILSQLIVSFHIFLHLVHHLCQKSQKSQSPGTSPNSRLYVFIHAEWQLLANEKYAVNIARCIRIMHSMYFICILYTSKYYYTISCVCICKAYSMTYVNGNICAENGWALPDGLLDEAVPGGKELKEVGSGNAGNAPGH